MGSTTDEHMTKPSVIVDVLSETVVNLRVSIPASAPQPPVAGAAMLQVPQGVREAILKRIEAFEPNLQRVEGARLKFERMGTSNQFNANLCVEMASGLGADVLDMRGDIKALREALTDLGVI